jgi:hypothetical protein
MPNDEDQDEVSFWREMIQQWEALNAEPVPQRMREALAHAESKFLVLKETLTNLTRRLH